MLIGIVDVETTGLDPDNDDLVEVAMARYDTDLGFVDVWSCLINHNGERTAAFEIHGIEHELTEKHGADPGRPLPGGVDVYVAHNADFDRQWVLTDPAIPWACTMDFEWPRTPPSRGLTALALAHGVGVLSAHRAVSDVLTLVRVFDRAAELGADLEWLVKRAMRPKATYQALVGFAEKDLAKDAGFHWQPESKRWLKRAFTDEHFGFETKEVTA